MDKRVVWAGRYAVFDELAAGGMASVYLACRIGEGESPRVVAIKKMFESFAKRPEFVTMFLDEAHVAARVRHPNVVATYEFLRIPDSLAIVMEFILGISLVDLGRIAEDRGQVAPLPVTVAVVTDALRGLHAAHEATNDRGEAFNLVHRDVSPHNILVGKDGISRVIDFGIAKAAGRLQVTEVGVMKGKYAYMAPEQIRSEPVDRRVDVYAAGIVLWEAVTGHPLFRDATNSAIFAKRASGTVTAPPPSTINPDLPPGLDDLIVQAVAFEPERRFATTAAFADALATVVKPAPREAVTEWILSLAESRLRELEAKRNDVERSFSSGDLAGHALDAGEVVSKPRVTPAPLVLDVPDLPLPPASAKKREPSALPPDKPASKRAFGDDFPAVPITDIKLDYSLSPGGEPSRRPARASTARSRPPARETDARGHRIGWWAFLVVAGGAVAGAYSFAPSFIQSSTVAAAERRGVALRATSASLRSGGVTLSGVTLALVSVGEVSMKAPEVDLDLDLAGNVKRVSVPGYEITLHGKASEVASHLAAWRAGAHLPLAFEATSGHVLWSDAIIPGVDLEGLDVKMTMGAKGNGSLAVDAASLTTTLRRGALGPWRAHVESTEGETAVRVAFDRSRDDASPNLTLVVRPKLGAALTVALPRSKGSSVGVPAELLHAGGDPEIALALEAQVAPPGDPLTAHGSLGLYGVPTASGPVDLVFEGAFQGDTAEPLRIDPGTLTVGKIKTRMTGTVTFEAGAIRFSVDRPAQGKVTPPPFVFDTHEWTESAPLPAPPASASPPRPRR